MPQAEVKPDGAARANARAAREAGLRYVLDTGPGIKRVRSGAGFKYLDGRGKALRDENHLTRIRALAIPPAWTGVWICPDAQGHVQAVGRDARARKQYRYHPDWRASRDSNKFDKCVAFAKALPRIRRRVRRDLSLKGLKREKVLAAVIRLLETTLIRVGNDEYARSNDSFGLTTLRDRHAAVNGATVRFSFNGKSGIRHEIDLSDRKLASIVRQCQDLPGHELFQYIDDEGQVRDIGSADVNEYLREVAGDEFTAKDFRTWAGTVLAAMALQELAPFTSQRQAKKNVVRAVEAVARKLGNTVSVCRKCYIHPAILDSYMDGTLARTLQRRVEKKLESGGEGGTLSEAEGTVLRLLRRRLSEAAEGVRMGRGVA